MRNQNSGFWILAAAIVLGTCLVIASIITVLPKLFEALALENEQTNWHKPSIYVATDIPTLPAATLATISEAYVEDKLEGTSPDFRKLIVSYDNKMVYITIVFNSGVDKLMGADYMYLYGTHNDMIRLSKGSFRLERDSGADGHFEEIIYSGSIKKVLPDTVSLEVPINNLPDIAEKKIWIYSMQSKDRIPDDGFLLMPADIVNFSPTNSVTHSLVPTADRTDTLIPVKEPTFTPVDTAVLTNKPSLTSIATDSLSPQPTFTPAFSPTPPPTIEALWLNLPAPTISANNVNHLKYQASLGIWGRTALSANAQYLAVISGQRVVLYDFKTLFEKKLGEDISEEAQGVASQVELTDLSFSPNSELLVATYTTILGGGFWIWRTNDGELLYSSKDNWGWLHSVAFSPDGRKIALGFADGSIVIFDVYMYEVFSSWKAHTWIVDDMAFSMEGTLLASVSRDNSIKLWNPTNGTLLSSVTGKKTDEPFTGGVGCVAFSPSSNFLATGSDYGFVELWQILKMPYKLQQDLVLEAENNGAVSDLAFSRDNTYLVTSSWHGTRFWSIPKGTLIHELKKTNGNIVYSPDNILLIIGNQFWMVK